MQTQSPLTLLLMLLCAAMVSVFGLTSCGGPTGPEAAILKMQAAIEAKDLAAYEAVVDIPAVTASALHIMRSFIEEEMAAQMGADGGTPGGALGEGLMAAAKEQMMKGLQPQLEKEMREEVAKGEFSWGPMHTLQQEGFSSEAVSDVMEGGTGYTFQKVVKTTTSGEQGTATLAYTAPDGKTVEVTLLLTNTESGWRVTGLPAGPGA